MNKVTLMGRLTKDVELRTSQSGNAFASFTLAVDRAYTKKGEDKQTDFISCKAFGKTAENIAKFFSKGSMIAVDGRIQTGSYEKDGHKVYTTDVIVDGFYFCGDKNGKNKSDSNSSSNDVGFTYVEGDDELPF